MGELVERPTAVATRSRSLSRGPDACPKPGRCVRLVDQVQCAPSVSVLHRPLFVTTPAAVRPDGLLTRASYASKGGAGSSARRCKRDLVQLLCKFRLPSVFSQGEAMVERSDRRLPSFFSCFAPNDWNPFLSLILICPSG